MLRVKCFEKLILQVFFRVVMNMRGWCHELLIYPGLSPRLAMANMAAGSIDDAAQAVLVRTPLYPFPPVGKDTPRRAGEGFLPV